MDRYQFEDLISDYIENTLTLTQRKEFEQHLKADPQLKEIVESVRQVMKIMKASPAVKTSPDFMTKLHRRVARERSKPTPAIPMQSPDEFSIFGFKPAYAGLMVALVVAVLYVGSELFPTDSGTEVVPPRLTAKVTTPPSTNSDLTVPQGPNLLASEEEDSTTATAPSRTNKFEDKIQLVGNKQQ